MPAAENAVSSDIATLYTDHHGWLHGWLRKKLGCGHHAADLAHDTFLRILTAQAEPAAQPPRQLLAGLREPRAYLTTIAGRLLLNHYRRLSLEQAWLATLAVLPEAHSPSPEDRVLILETLHEIDAMLDGLPPKARTAFLLSQLDGLTYAQIAEQLGVTVRTVKRYMAQAFEACLMRVS